MSHRKRLAAMHDLLRAVAVAILTSLSTGAASAAEVVIHVAALNKALVEQVFKENGRHYLGTRDRCNQTYLEHPSVVLRGERVFIRARLYGRTGTEVFGSCVSVSDPSWLTISGRPVATGTVLGISDLTVTELEKERLRPLITGWTSSADARRGLQVDLQDAVRRAVQPQNTKPYSVDVARISLSRMRVSSDRLIFDLDFVLEVR